MRAHPTYMYLRGCWCRRARSPPGAPIGAPPSLAEGGGGRGMRDSVRSSGTRRMKRQNSRFALIVYIIITTFGTSLCISGRKAQAHGSVSEEVGSAPLASWWPGRSSGRLGPRTMLAIRSKLEPTTLRLDPSSSPQEGSEWSARPTGGRAAHRWQPQDLACPT